VRSCTVGSEMPRGRVTNPLQAHHRSDVVHAFKWSILGEAASRLIAPVAFLVLARLLTPEDFGVVAAATVVISLCQAVADAGLGKALVQKRDMLEASADAAFWMSFAVSLALGLVLIAAAPAIAGFFDDARIAPVVRVLALQVPLTGLAAIPIALLQRELAFRELFWVRLLTAGLPALASIPMALTGAGYWALVVGAVTGQALQCVALSWRSHWRPRLRLDMATARQLARFGRWTSLSAVLAWCYGWLDSLFVARYLGAHDMGLYRIGNTLVTLVFGLAFAPLLPVLYSLFSRSGHNSNRVGMALLANARVTMVVSLPVATLFVLLAEPIELYFFGPEWTGLAYIVAVLAVGQGFAWLVGANGEAYRAVDRPDFEVWVMGLSLLAYGAGYAVAIRHGLAAFVLARTALVFIGLALHICFAAHLFTQGVREWLRALAKPALFVAIALAAAKAASITIGGIAANTVLPVTFCTGYLLLIIAFDRRHLATLRKQLYGA
jgi:O-antigen/teichoic acid export membrane protein